MPKLTDILGITNSNTTIGDSFSTNLDSISNASKSVQQATPKNLTLNNQGLFVPFESNDIVTNQKEQISEPVWSSGVGGVLTSFYTSSEQYDTSGDYYINVYQEATSSDTSEVQFSVAYGNLYGSGSAPINDDSGDTSLTPSKAIYYQYKNILLDSSETSFSREDGVSMENIGIINFQRNRLKQNLDSGNWELTLNDTGGTITLIDDSSENVNPAVTEGGKVYNVVSGSLATGDIHTSASVNDVYGLLYPEHGFILLDLDKVSTNTGMTVGTATGSENVQELYDNIVNGSSFAARNSQSISSTYYFVRIKNNQFNFSNNPSFTTGSYGDLKYGDMVKDPQVYLTTVGLYNDDNELLAVAKISQPILKTFNSETSIRIKLDF